MTPVLFPPIFTLQTNKNGNWNFFKCLKVRLRKYADENLIIGGDMNCCLSPEDNRRGRPTEQKKQVIESIHALL